MLYPASRRSAGAEASERLAGALPMMIVMAVTRRREEPEVVAPTSIPCPSCGKMNGLTAKTCSACGYAFIPGSEPDGGETMMQRVTGWFRGRKR